MMVSILKARFLAKTSGPNDAGDDSGSDMRDCMDREVIDDESGSAEGILRDTD